MLPKGQLAFLMRVHANPVTLSLGRRPLLRLHQQVIRSRQFTSSCRKCIHVTYQQSGARADNVVRPAGMWLVPRGSQLDQLKLLSQLPKLHQGKDDLRVALFFVTPQCAHLFNDDNPFQSRVINTIFPRITSTPARQSIVAVVDALPILEKDHRPKKREIDGAEGVALCILPNVGVLPAQRADDNLPTVSMTGNDPFFDGERPVLVSISGRVANTTFVNGRRSTMHLRNWWLGGDEQWLPDTERQAISHVDIPILPLIDRGPSPMTLNTRIVRLTAPSVVLSSMGNIVRSVKTSTGKELAASHELEELVPKKLKELQKLIPTVELRVFALVYPSSLCKGNPFTDLLWKEDGASAKKGRLSALLIAGARLYRVTSGGAGWGKKAGLLSLEPVTELSASPPDSSDESPSFLFDDDQEIRMPGSADLFPPGYIIQFMATHHDSEGLVRSAISIDETKESLPSSEVSLSQWTRPDRIQHFCIGNIVLPEAHQYTAVTGSHYDTATGESAKKQPDVSQTFSIGRFGFLTNSALSLSTKVPQEIPGRPIEAVLGATQTEDQETAFKRKHSTLIELPNSYFVARCLANGNAVFTQTSDPDGTPIIKAVTSEIQGAESAPQQAKKAKRKRAKKSSKKTLEKPTDPVAHTVKSQTEVQKKPVFRFVGYEHPRIHLVHTPVEPKPKSSDSGNVVQKESEKVLADPVPVSVIANNEGKTLMRGRRPLIRDMRMEIHKIPKTYTRKTTRRVTRDNQIEVPQISSETPGLPSEMDLNTKESPDTDGIDNDRPQTMSARRRSHQRRRAHEEVLDGSPRKVESMPPNGARRVESKSVRQHLSARTIRLVRGEQRVRQRPTGPLLQAVPSGTRRIIQVRTRLLPKLNAYVHVESESSIFNNPSQGSKETEAIEGLTGSLLLNEDNHLLYRPRRDAKETQVGQTTHADFGSVWNTPDDTVRGSQSFNVFSDENNKRSDNQKEGSSNDQTVK